MGEKRCCRSGMQMVGGKIHFVQAEDWAEAALWPQRWKSTAPGLISKGNLMMFLSQRIWNYAFCKEWF